MTAPLPEIPTGTVLAGKYRVERTLGAGGMGFVVAATHLELQQLVAVKLLHGGAVSNPEAVVRFMREAQAAARIRSEHVAHVIDVGRLADGEPYMVMEFLEGQDLGALLRDGPLSVEDAVDYVGQACHAVAEAHGAGIVHRDLKPSNLFLARRPDGMCLVKVLDFGISKLSNPGGLDAELTKTAAMLGSPFYMSPEQMRSARDVDPRTDIWALGVILYELLSGKLPFHGETLPELVTSVVISSPVPLLQLRPDAPPALAALVARCLEKNPAQRFQSVAELAWELLPHAPRQSQLLIERVARASVPGPKGAPDGRAHASVSPSRTLEPPRGAEAEAAAAGTGAPWSRTRGAGARRSRKAVWTLGAAVAALGAAGAIVALMRAPSNASLAPTSASQLHSVAPLQATVGVPELPPPQTEVALPHATTPAVAAAPPLTPKASGASTHGISKPRPPQPSHAPSAPSAAPASATLARPQKTLAIPIK